MTKIGLKTPKSKLVHNMAEALKAIKSIGFPAIMRPAFTLGGMGGGIAYNMEEFKHLTKWGLDCSPIKQILVEQYTVHNNSWS